MIQSHVKEVCERRGIENANQLHTRLVQQIPNASLQTAYDLWRGDFTRIALHTLDVLCSVLNCKVADLLKNH